MYPRLTVRLHATIKAFSEAAGLAPIANPLVNQTRVVIVAVILCTGTDAPSEEALASFTRHHSKVVPGSVVTANAAYLLDLLFDVIHASQFAIWSLQLLRKWLNSCNHV